MSRERQIQFRLDEATYNQLPSLPPKTENIVARQIVGRYLKLQRWTLDEIKELFTVPEVSLIADVLNGLDFTSFEIPPASALRGNLEDAISTDSVHIKWKVDLDGFRQKLQRLTNSQAAAIIEVVDQWWHDPDRQLTREGFEKYGLIVQE